ncbi:hypothetical protein [Streptantibioticus ferralitis]|uniref:hypothetical protein n=1 Tax=Streptantibioticus ferralitis TaxID=236510 RepID=UPI0033701A69
MERCPLLQPDVVRLADARQTGHLVPSQARHPPLLAVRRHPYVCGLELRTAGSQEPPQLRLAVHVIEYGRGHRGPPAPASVSQASPRGDLRTNAASFGAECSTGSRGDRLISRDDTALRELAGVENVVHLIGNSVLGLLQRP